MLNIISKAKDFLVLIKVNYEGEYATDSSVYIDYTYVTLSYSVMTYNN